MSEPVFVSDTQAVPVFVSDTQAVPLDIGTAAEAVEFAIGLIEKGKTDSALRILTTLHGRLVQDDCLYQKAVLAEKYGDAIVTQ